MQKWGDSYWEKYSPVVNMMSVRLILAIAKLHNLDPKAIDFVLAFPQVDLEEDIWVYLPIGFQVNDHTEASSERSLLLKLNKIYMDWSKDHTTGKKNSRSPLSTEILNLQKLINVYTLKMAW